MGNNSRIALQIFTMIIVEICSFGAARGASDINEEKESS